LGGGFDGETHSSCPAVQNGHLKRALPDEWMPKQRCSKGKSPLIHRTRTRTAIPCTRVGVFNVCVSSTRARSTWASSESESPLRISIQSCGRRAAFLAASDASKIRSSQLPAAGARSAPARAPAPPDPKQVARWHGGEGAHEAEGVRLERPVAYGRPVRPDAELQVGEEGTCETPLSVRIALDDAFSYLQGQAEGVKQLVDFDAPLESAEPLERGLPYACRVRGLDQVNPNPNPNPCPNQR
jgi:hypothetical protein